MEARVKCYGLGSREDERPGRVGLEVRLVLVNVQLPGHERYLEAAGVDRGAALDRRFAARLPDQVG